jgi:chromosome segregation ATPase
MYSESEQEKLINYIQEANQQLGQQNEEFTELRAEVGVMESRNYQEKREIERLEADLRDATAYSQKCYGDIQRLKEAITTRDLDIRGFKLKIE